MRISRLGPYLDFVDENKMKIGFKSGFFVFPNGSAGNRSIGADSMTDFDSILISVGRAAWAWWIATEDEKLYRYGVLLERLFALERSFSDDTEIRHLEVLL